MARFVGLSGGSAGLTAGEVKNLVGQMFTNATHDGAAATYSEASGTVTFSIAGAGADLTQEDVEQFVIDLLDFDNGISGAIDSETGDLVLRLTGAPFTANDRTKLDGIAAGATANATNASLRDRSTHSGQQPISSVEQLAETLAGLEQEKSNVGHNHTQEDIEQLPEDLTTIDDRLNALESKVITGIRTANGTLYLDRVSGIPLEGQFDPLPPPDTVAPSFSIFPTLVLLDANTYEVHFGEIGAGNPTPTLTGVLTRPNAAPEAVTDLQQITILPAERGLVATLAVTASNIGGSITETATLTLPTTSITLPAGFIPAQDYRIDKALNYNWSGSNEIFLPGWFNGVFTYGDPTKVTYNAAPDKSITLDAEYDPVSGNWESGKLQYQNPRKGKGRWGAVVTVTEANAVAAFFAYNDNLKEIDFELTRRNGVVGWAPAVHMPKTGGGRASSNKRVLAHGPFTPGVPQVLEFELFNDRCEFYVDGVLFETVVLADMATGYIWDTTTPVAIIFSVEKHDTWAGWVEADYQLGGQMVVHSIMQVKAAPARVTGVSASVSGSTVNLLWSAPAANNSPITDYEVRLDGNVVADGIGTSTFFTLTDVAAGAHTVTVAAINAEGTGQASSAVTFEITAAPDFSQMHTFAVDEGIGTTIESDLGRTGILTGPAWVPSPSRLNFTLDRGEIPVSGAGQDQPVLLGALVRFNATSGVRQIMTRDHAPTSQRHFHFRQYAGALGVVTFAGTTGTPTDFAGTVAAGEWLIAIVLLNAADGQLWKNGEDLGTFNFPARNLGVTNRSFLVGASWTLDGSGIREAMDGDDLAGLSIKMNATLADVPTMEAKLRAIAAQKTITVPEPAQQPGGGTLPYEPDMTTGRIAPLSSGYGGRAFPVPAGYYVARQDEFALMNMGA